MNKQLLLLGLLLFTLFARVYFQDGLEKPVEQDPELDMVASYFEPMRNFLAKQAESLLPEPQGALLAGMVLGVKSDLSTDFKQALRKTSTIHIVVVSGQNLTLLAGFIFTLAPIFGRKKTVMLSLIVVIFYAFLTGLQIPVIRAGLMVMLASLAQLFNREKESGWILGLTGLMMLIYNPNWLLSISFQLSFLATIGVVIVAPEFIKRWTILPKFIKEDLAVSLAAQLLTWPVIAANFHQVSWIGVVVNSLILFSVPIIMITGALVLILNLVSPTIAAFLALVPGVFLTYFVYIVRFFDQKWTSYYIGQVSWFIWVGYYFLILGLFLSIKQKRT